VNEVGIIVMTAQHSTILELAQLVQKQNLERRDF